MSDSMEFERETAEIFQRFYDSRPVSYEVINSSRGDTDFREVIIAELESGEKAVIKLSDNDFTFPEKITMWQRTIHEYRRLGYYCPEIIPDRSGGFPVVQYKGRSCIAYAEEYSPYPAAEGRDDFFSDTNIRFAQAYKDAWIMTAKIAAKYLSYTEYPSAYCLFETFCPSDKTDEVLEHALKWKDCAQALPEELQPQVQRIWELWIANRNVLEPIYKKLPTSVFQADLNSTNILLDEQGKFVGVFDFNLCGRDVFLNYLFRETRDWNRECELNAILKRLKEVSAYYRFSEEEKQAALMLYRCLKPLWCGEDRLKELEPTDIAVLRACLDETEYFLTRDIDFPSYMTAE